VIKLIARCRNSLKLNICTVSKRMVISVLKDINIRRFNITPSSRADIDRQPFYRCSGLGWAGQGQCCQHQQQDRSQGQPWPGDSEEPSIGHVHFLLLEAYHTPSGLGSQMRLPRGRLATHTVIVTPIHSGEAIPSLFFKLRSYSAGRVT
jgi:hypothetical protein